MKRLNSAREFLSSFSKTAAFSFKTSWQASRSLLVAKFFLYAVQGLLPLAIAYLAGRIIDSVVAAINSPNPSVSQPVFLIALITVIGYVHNQSLRISRYTDQLSRVHYLLLLERSLQSKFGELDHSYYEDPDFSRRNNKVRENLQYIYRFADELMYAFGNLIQLVATGGALLFFNPLITLILLIGILPQLRVQMQAAKERYKYWDTVDHDWRFRQDLRWALTSTMVISEMKIFNLTKYLGRLWQKYFKKTEFAWMDIERKIRNRQALASLSETGVQFGVSIWLLVRVLQKAGFTIGSFEFYRRLINDFSSTMSRMVSGMQVLSETSLYVRDYQELMQLKSRIAKPPRGLKLPLTKIPAIEFRDVSFKYPNRNRYVLRNLSFKIQPGEDVALVGENGAGKSTLVKLLMRFYDVTEGEILIGGVNIKKLSLEDWYKHVGVLFQDFNYYQYFKVRRSIGVGDISKIKDEEGIKEAARQAGASKFIERMPAGYDTVLSKVYREGTELSGGEWQRLALARAFFRNANILILDEPTAAIDAKGEYEIFQKIAKTQQKKTTIIISHRFSTVRNAHKIYVINKGSIIEQGSHEELLKINDGTYKEMFELQAAGYR